MGKKVFQVTLTIVFLLIMVLPVLQVMTRMLPEPRLSEKRQLTSRPGLTVSSFLSREFQNQFDAYMNDNYGFRSLMVMLNNQINITIFRVTR